jgi:predicted nucleotidyltransferase
LNTPALPRSLRPLVADLRAALGTLYGDRLVRLVLYGSHARGEAHAESDVDVLVVLRGPVAPGAEVRRMSDVRTAMLLRHDRFVSLLPVAADVDQARRSAWVANARAEGVTL